MGCNATPCNKWASAIGRLKAAFDRLQSTTVLTSIRQPAERRRHRFSWINEWHERSDSKGRPDGIELIVPDWFYRAVLDDALILTIDRAYFDLTGGLDRWLYRLVRKHGGRQRRAADDALGRRTVAQPDDRADRAGNRHADRCELCRTLWRL